MPTTAAPDPRKVLAREIDDAAKHKAGGSVIVGIASLAQLKSLGMEEKVRGVVEVLVDNHAGAEDGLFEERGAVQAATQKADSAPGGTGVRRVGPTYVVAQAAAAWVLSAELFAACTRRGQTPAMYQSIMVPKADAWNQPLLKKRFHDDGVKCEPIEVGRLGKAYLCGLRGVLLDVSTASWPEVLEGCDRLAGVIGDGGHVYLGAFGHYPYYHHAGKLPTDPGVCLRLNDGQKLVGKPDIADAALVIGYCLPPDGKVFGNYLYGDPDMARGAGRGVVWVLTGYMLKKADFKKDELLVDQRWGEGDAVVDVPGYPIRVFPSSGVVAETLMWAMQAQIAQQVAAERASRKVK